jgi:hypothetical protein
MKENYFAKLSRGGEFQHVTLASGGFAPVGDDATPKNGDIVWINDYVSSADFTGQQGRCASQEVVQAHAFASAHGLRVTASSGYHLDWVYCSPRVMASA